MSNEADIKEFIELVGKTADPPPKEPYDPDHYIAPLGNVVQWVNMGDNKFTPSGPTSQSLPSGVYKAETTNRGELLWGLINLKTDELLRLPDTASDRVIASIQHFWASKSKFIAKRQLYKRGMLLWGPPGSGKTATVTLLIDDLITNNGIVLVVDEPGVATEALRQFRKIEPDRPIICVLEDLDELVHVHGESGILSLLDGEAQVDNIVHIATTNYPERLDGRIINRPSRFDEVMKIGMPTSEAREVYLRSKITDGELTAAQIKRWVKDTDGLSVAHLRELVVAVFCLDRDYADTLARLKGMARKVSSQSDGKSLGFGNGKNE